MRKILIYDHRFNVESISSCSKIDNSIVFYDRLPTLSFYDNFDKVKPDELWINTFFCPQDFLSNVKQNVKIKIIDYRLEYIIPNAFADVSGVTENNTISCILQHDEPNSNKIYRYENQYVKFYTLNQHNINHIQYSGSLQSCKDLTDIVVSSNKVIFDDDVCRNLCSFYNKPYAQFKQGGTLSWEFNTVNTLTNRDVFFENISK